MYTGSAFYGGFYCDPTADDYGTVLVLKNSNTGVIVAQIEGRTNSTRDTFFNHGGNVGIGTDTATDKLTVGSTTDTTSFMTLLGEYQSSGFTNSNIFNFRHGGTDRIRLTTVQQSAASNDFDFKIQAIDGAVSAYEDWFTVKGKTGYVGIGTVTPGQELEVVGDAFITSKLYIGSEEDSP
jgi:hypothetical protein